ncbi:unnamed protein product (macronuclear) [Paramecium tetraurelia]|uniref:Transmembrane protein n=1 Tax=Paramecium tetraurelia TaxID=5888 RepID=A0CV65_PARTE|nr:uncharacterized protein GSPATT00010850001 [Paramecium tetraurelia]CAK74682.1 unnamed protein product [Paramecium tetraurelia]|eukprot:XP_001442079.1 hypothetical protein (macronuclear) [Paramecium tetraurelia strain d4-2]
MLQLFLLIVIAKSQINLVWQIYNPDSGLTSQDQSITFGQYNKEIRVWPSDGSSFKSEFQLSGNLPMSPQFPIARINSKYVSFYVGITENSGSTLSLSKTTNSQYQFSQNAITFVPSSKQCVLTPSADFNTIPIGGKRQLTLDFINCIPITGLQIKVLYETISKTIIQKNRERFAFIEVSSLNAAVDTSISISFQVNSTYYLISTITLKVVANSQSLPVSSIVNKNSGTCTGAQAVFTFNCGKKSMLYYSYSYQNQAIDITKIKEQLLLNRLGKQYTNVNTYEGYGQSLMADNSNKDITLTGLRSNTVYTILAICEDELYQQSQSAISFNRCDSQQTIKKIQIQSYQQFQTINLRDIACDLMLQLSLKQNQVSSADGIFCNQIAQSKINGNKQYYIPQVSQTQLSTYTFFVYPDYATTYDYTVNSVSISQYEIQKQTIEKIIPKFPTVNQEFFIADENFLNFTITLKTDGFISIGLDLLQTSLPDQYQFSNGLNYLNNPFIKFYRKFLIANEQYWFQFKLSDKNDYQLIYQLASNPSDGAQYSPLQVRKFTLVQMQEIYNIIICLSFIMFFNL